MVGKDSQIQNVGFAVSSGLAYHARLSIDVRLSGVINSRVTGVNTLRVGLDMVIIRLELRTIGDVAETPGD